MQKKKKNKITIASISFYLFSLSTETRSMYVIAFNLQSIRRFDTVSMQTMAQVLTLQSTTVIYTYEKKTSDEHHMKLVWPRK